MNAIKTETEETKIALINNNISYIQKDIAMINSTLKELTGVYLGRQEFMDFKNSDFATIKRLVYGAVGVILLGFIGALVSFFVNVQK